MTSGVRSTRGFTLIELLVVITIIGILSSVVLSALNTARDKGNVSAIKAQVNEFRKLLELEYLETGSYANLTSGSGWVGTAAGGATCETKGFAGTYAARAIEICNNLRNLITYDAYEFHVGVDTTGGGRTLATHYSLMAYLPGPTPILYCVGSSGAISSVAGGPYTSPGCRSNP